MTSQTTERAGCIEFRVLGSVEIVADGQPVDLNGRKSREVLALLLLHANEAVPQARIVDDLWGEDPPLTVDTSLRVAVSKLRKGLEPAGARHLLESRQRGYALRVGEAIVDAIRFEELAAEGGRLLEETAASEASDRLREALALWRGPPYADLSDLPDAISERRRLNEIRLEAEDDLCEALLALGRHKGVVHELETLVGQHPTRERRAAQLMLALYRSGRQADALETYLRTRTMLHD